MGYYHRTESDFFLFFLGQNKIYVYVIGRSEKYFILFFIFILKWRKCKNMVLICNIVTLKVDIIAHIMHEYLQIRLIWDC